MLLPSGNPFKCLEEVLSLQPMIPPKRFDIFPPDWGMLRRYLDAFRFFIKQRSRNMGDMYQDIVEVLVLKSVSLMTAQP